MYKGNTSFPISIHYKLACPTRADKSSIVIILEQGQQIVPYQSVNQGSRSLPLFIPYKMAFPTQAQHYTSDGEKNIQCYPINFLHGCSKQILPQKFTLPNICVFQVNKSFPVSIQKQHAMPQPSPVQ